MLAQRSGKLIPKFISFYLLSQIYLGMSIPENQVSIKMKKINTLNEKIKPFRQQFTQSLSRFHHKSSIHNLVGSVYSQKNNKEFTPVKTMRPPSAKHNPEMGMSSSALKGLDMRASHIPNLSDINTELLNQKKRLEERIAKLKEDIAKETRLKNRAETTWKTAANHNTYTHQAYDQLCKKSQKLNEGISQVRSQNYQLTQQINQLRTDNKQKNIQKNQQDENVKRLTNLVNTLKSSLIQTEKDRNSVKDNLIRKQRVMDSLSIETKQLENQRAMVLLDINNSVLRNKL